ncbi:MAG: HEAT repeat domain-containing protein [Candidatus Wallbacteria bacterium]|nr:HEAT repeat domain-containing protein [Candidatus Wallbacteria bacterium]
MTTTRLENRLESPDWETRFVAVRELGSRSGRKTMEMLRQAAADRHQSVRCAAAICLGNFPGKEAVDCLVELLADPDEWVRLRATQSLGKIRAPETLDYLVQHLETEEDVKVRATMVKAIGAYADERYLPILVNCLQDEDLRVRANTIESLGNFKSKKVQRIVKGFVKDPNSRIRANAARVLALTGSQVAARRTFHEMLKSENQYTRSSAVFALGELRQDAFLSSLLRLTGDVSFVVRRNVVDALVKYGSAICRQVEGLLDDRDPLRRAIGCQVLAQTGDRRSLKKLIPLLEDADGEVRARAEEAVDRIRRRDE